MNNFFTSLLSLIAIVTRFEIQISFYVTRFFFQNKVGYVLFLLLATFLFICLNSSLGFCGSPALRLVYSTIYSFYMFLTESATQVFSLSRFQWVRKRTKNLVGDSFLDEMDQIGKQKKGRSIVLLIKAYFPLCLCQIIEVIDVLHNQNLKMKDFHEYMKTCNDNKVLAEPKELAALQAKDYSYLNPIRSAIVNFFASFPSESIS